MASTSRSLPGFRAAIVRRAREILSELESGERGGDDRAHRRQTMRDSASPGNLNIQLTLFGEPNPALQELKDLDVESLSPLEAITKLFELQRKIRKD